MEKRVFDIEEELDSSIFDHFKELFETDNKDENDRENDKVSDSDI